MYVIFDAIFVVNLCVSRASNTLWSYLMRHNRTISVLENKANRFIIFAVTKNRSCSVRKRVKMICRFLQKIDEILI